MALINDTPLQQQLFWPRHIQSKCCRIFVNF